tara:strand:- start:1095 stop:1268 length:174 start_codon:yes stop_codon:yes gene_type:complete
MKGIIERLENNINENYIKVDEMYKKVTYIQELLDDRNIAEAKREIEYLRQELQYKNR